MSYVGIPYEGDIKSFLKNYGLKKEEDCVSIAPLVCKGRGRY